jgi:hypothetical protein
MHHALGDVDAHALVEVPRQGTGQAPEPTPEVQRALAALGVAEFGGAAHDDVDLDLAGGEELVAVPRAVPQTRARQDRPVGVELGELVPVALLLADLHGEGDGRRTGAGPLTR